MRVEQRFAHARVPPRLHFDPADRYYQGERQIFSLCKRSLLSRSPELGKLLSEKEAEINLVGMLPLPLVFLTAALVLRSGDIGQLPLTGSRGIWTGGILFFGILLVIHLLLRFHQLRKEEFRMCLESFLLVESGLAGSIGASSGEDKY